MASLPVHVATASLIPLIASAITPPSPLQGGAQPSSICAGYVKDAAAPSNCLTASSVPTLGSLFPLSQDFYVSPQGSVGLGSLNPATRLDVRGDVTCELINSIAPFPTLRMRGTTGQQAYYEWQVAPDGSCYLYDINRPAYRVYVNSSGLVGLGTTVPAVALHVVRNSSATSGIRMTSTGPYGEVASVDVEHAATGTGWHIGTGASDFGGVGGLGFRRFGGPTAMVVQSGGNVGIGTTAPTARLDVAGETATNTLRIRGGSDVAEGFDSAGAKLEPGTVVVLDDVREGAVVASASAYDRKVVGVVSGAGGVNSGLVLSQDGVLDGDVQVAMVGRVYVNCSAENGAIRPGDRLTTASLAGHAMKATDSALADGAVIGKAAGTLADGTGLVLVVVNLQ